MVANVKELAMEWHLKNRQPKLPPIEKPKMKISTKAKLLTSSWNRSR